MAFLNLFFKINKVLAIIAIILVIGAVSFNLWYNFSYIPEHSAVSATEQMSNDGGTTQARTAIVLYPIVNTILYGATALVIAVMVIRTINQIRKDKEIS